MENNIGESLEDDYVRKRLLNLTIQHVKLALEFIHRGTSLERQEIIKKQIHCIRQRRDRLLITKPKK